MFGQGLLFTSGKGAANLGGEHFGFCESLHEMWCNLLKLTFPVLVVYWENGKMLPDLLRYKRSTQQCKIG